MPNEQLVRRILRSLCANTREEESSADVNYKNTDIFNLNFGPVATKFIEMMSKLYTSNGGPPTTSTIRDQAQRVAETELSLFAESVGAETAEWGSNYSVLVEEYIEERDQELMQTILQDTAQIMKDGREEKGVVIRGVKNALQHLVQQTVELQHRSDPRQRSLSNVEASRKLHTEYITRRDQPTMAYGLGTGLTPIDEATKGAQIGELWTLAGFVSHGKTTWALSWARYLAIEGGFNVLYFTLEMPREQAWRILATGHSAHPKFGRPPLDYEKVKSGTLSKEEENFYLNEILPDLRDPNHGLIEVEKPIGRTTMSEIRARAEVLNRSHPLDMIIIDYLGLLAAEKGSKVPKSERINENFILAKQLALEFDHGYGVAVVTPHQINRQGAKAAADNNGVYEINALADANECERSSDTIFAIYQDGPFRQKKECVITNLKNRDGRIVQPFNAYLPAEHRFVAELTIGEGRLTMDAIVNA